MSSKKKRRQDRPRPVVQERPRGAPWPFIGIAVAVIAGAGLFVAFGSSDLPPSTDTTDLTTQAPTTAGAGSPDASPPGDPGSIASAVSGTPFSAGEPNDLPMPPLPYMSQMSSPPEQVRQAYVFAAQNPGVLEYVPCYCGCELDGHRSNVDCFVESRASNGAVERWDTHGMT